jgi:hypothetical protein
MPSMRTDTPPRRTDRQQRRIDQQLTPHLSGARRIAPASIAEPRTPMTERPKNTVGQRMRRGGTGDQHRQHGPARDPDLKVCN